MSLKNTENTFVLGIFLGLVAVLSAFVLAYFSNLTKEPIAAAKIRTFASSIRQVLPDFANDPSALKIEKEGVTFYVALDAAGKVVGVAGEGTTRKGYSGPITALVGLLPSGSVRTVIVTAQSETPGLGSVVCNRTAVKTLSTVFSGEKQTGLPPNLILDAFTGKIADDDPWRVEKDGGTIPYKTGATVTSRAVTDAVYRIARVFAQNKAEILALADKKEGK